MVSYLHYRRALGFAGSMSDLIAEQHPVYSNWWSHTRQWLENPYEAELIRVRYEDLLVQPEIEMSRIARFLGIEPDEDVIARLAERTSFGRMRSREQRQGWDGMHWPGDKKFVRRGVAGAYRDEMAADDLARFEDLAHGELREIGYEI